MHQKKCTPYIFLFIILFVLLMILNDSHPFRFRQEISLNRYHITLKKGEKYSLKAYCIGHVRYQSQNIRIASVSPAGTIYAHGTGTTYIIVTSKTKSSYCRVKVTSPQSPHIFNFFSYT